MSHLDHIAVMGTGNVGWNLVARMLSKGIPVKEVISSSAAQSDWPGEKALPIRTPEQGPSEEATMLLLCVPDDAITEIASQQRKGLAIAHCSGSTPLLDHPKSGVFYPFQTFTKGRIPAWEGIPIFVEGNDELLTDDLLKLGVQLAGNAELKDTDQRKVIHMSGVFGANFVNHILYLASKVLEKGDTNYEILKPLLEEVVRKSIELGPEASQTGPARRGDLSLIEAHIASLSDDPQLVEVYRLMSESIQKTYSN